MKIYYGIEMYYTDVTDLLRKKGDIIIIPEDDVKRFRYIGFDPLPNILKNIKIDDVVYKEEDNIKIDFINETVTIFVDESKQKLRDIHALSILKYGSFSEEFPEQMMACNYIQSDNIVLELGGNIGRNTVVISRLLSDSSNLVTLECDTDISNQLKENRELNKLSFHVENSALSKRMLIQRGWDTFPSDVVPPGYKRVNNISFNEIEEKYNKKFDTLVADCEGALYYILQDFSEMLTNIKTIIMENDYNILSHKEKVDEILRINGFKQAYVEAGGWGPCYDRFFEVWKK
jgi:FkbM family methyltransferase